MRQWFDIEKIKDSAAQICIFDEVGSYGCTVSDFNLQFNDVKDMESITLLINSPGGSVTEGIAIYNILSSVREKLSVEVLGLAGSISSIIALAGNQLILDEGSYLMIHDPSMISMGSSDDLRRDADLLDKIKSQIVNIYNNRTGIPIDQLAKMMKAETWMDAEEALENNFCSSINKGKPIQNNAFSNFDLSKYKKVPRNLTACKADINNLTIRELEKQLREDAGFSTSEAKKLASLYFKDKPRDEAKPEKNSTLEELLKIL